MKFSRHLYLVVSVSTVFLSVGVTDRWNVIMMVFGSSPSGKSAFR
jgi:hypothetical protein